MPLPESLGPKLSRNGHCGYGLLLSAIDPVRMHRTANTPTTRSATPPRTLVTELDEEKHVYMNATRKERVLEGNESIQDTNEILR